MGASLIGASLIVAVTPGGTTALPPEQSLVLEVETVESALGGLGRRGCRAQLEVGAGRKHELWLSFGEARPDSDKGWEAVALRTHCGPGSFERASAHFGRMLGVPYVILDLATVAADSQENGGRLETALVVRKLSGFDTQGRPVYEHSARSRTLRLAAEGETVLPLFIPEDAREKQAFEVSEVFLRIRARLLGRQPAAAYGGISVTADIPGAEILLDGGFVGRTSEQRPTLLNNVLVGEREVRARDVSGREVRKSVLVKKGHTSEVALKVLNLSSTGTGSGLVPIGKNPQGHEEFWRFKDGAIVVRVPAGTFLMGSAEGEGEPQERPQHRVDLSEFQIDKTEVTWRQFRKYAETTGVSLPPAPVWGTPDDYAVSNVLWSEAKAYCEWARGRLPTEAEWEKAARGTDGRTYPWGRDWDPDRCNSWQGGPHRPRSVGSYPNCLSPYGVLEMPGGVWEWCADWYGETYYAESASSDPSGPSEGRLRVLRGGAWLNQATWLRPAYRHRLDLFSRNVLNGFRCAQDATGVNPR